MVNSGEIKWGNLIPVTGRSWYIILKFCCVYFSLDSQRTFKEMVYYRYCHWLCEYRGLWWPAVNIAPSITAYPVRLQPCDPCLSIWTSRQSISGLIYRDKQPSSLTFKPMGNLEWPVTLSPSLHVFGLWDEAIVPRENPRRHGKNMQTHRKALTWELNPGPSCCEATALTTTYWSLSTKTKQNIYLC